MDKLISTKFILILALLTQTVLSAAFAERTISSENFNTLVNDVTADQMTTAHLFWSNDRIKDYLRRKRTLQNTKILIAQNAKKASDQNVFVQKLSETEF